MSQLVHARRRAIPANLRKIDLNLLTIFDAIFRERHISRAAERLGMSQSAVSHALSRLREILEDPLFERHASTMEPTRRALEIARPVQDALHDLAGILAPMEGFDARSTKRIFTIAMGDYCECLLLPPLMQWLNRNAPNIQISILPEDTPEARELLYQGRIDLLLDYMPLEADGIVARALYQEHLCVVASRTRANVGDQLSVASFASAKHVIYGRHSALGSLLEVALRREEVERTNVLVASSLVSMLLIASRSGLLASVPRKLAAHYADDLDLVIFPLPVEMEDLTVKMYWQQEQQEDPSHRWLRELLSRIAANL